MEAGDILGHEPMGRVVAVGDDVHRSRSGTGSSIPFNISCGSCYMCDRTLFAQCETTQVREHGKGASLFGYTKLYGHVPGAQAELLRVPQAQFGPIKVPEGPPDERFLFLSDVLPTAWQAVAYADVPDGRGLGGHRPRAHRPDGLPHRPPAGHRARLRRRPRRPSGWRWPSGTAPRSST